MFKHNIVSISRQQSAVNRQSEGREASSMPMTHDRPLIISLALTLLFVFFWGGISDAGTNLRTGVPELCYQCHSNIKASMSDASVHFPFKNGKCIACHNPHTGNIKGLLNDQLNTLCLECHTGVKSAMQKGNVHGALRQGSCGDCHAPHSGKNKKLLLNNVKDLCWKCHESLKEHLGRRHVHNTFKNGECSACHDPHGSAEEFQLLAPPNRTCKKCHAPRCNAKGVSLVHITKDMDCASCHSGHASDVKGLLGPFGHSSFLGKDCESCHVPFAANRPAATRLAGQDLCFSCHEKDPAKYREDDAHWGISGNPCAECHVYHASKKKSYTVREANVCFRCHESIRKKTAVMKKTVKRLKFPLLKETECFACHKPLHSSERFALRADAVNVCNACHEAQHKISHPLGEKAIDHRTGRPMDCLSCHSMHSARADYLMTFDRQREICVQCHRM